MGENIQITLYFKERFIYDPNTFIYEVSKKINNLGQAITLPINIGNNNPNDDMIPIIIFQQSQDIQLNANFNNINIVILNLAINVDEIILKIYDIVENFKLNISRIAFVENKKFSNEVMAKFKKQYFNDKEVIESDEFNFGWHKCEKFDDITVNFWQRFGTNILLSDELYVTYDINTLSDVKNNVDRNFAEKFIKNAKESIKNNYLK